LPAIFSDNMVLQRDQKVPVWGWAQPGARVTVEIARKSANAIADKSGRWKAVVGPLPAGGPHALLVKSARTVTLQNVMIGDVWIASGQSNMEWPLRLAKDPEKEIEAATHPSIRLVRIPHTSTPTRQTDTETSGWVVCSPSSIPDLSAVGYFFAREMQQHQGIPIGVIQTTWGGTPAESWTSPRTLAKLPDFAERIRELGSKALTPEEDKADLATRIETWDQKLASRDPGMMKGKEWFAPQLDTSKWKDAEMPQPFEKTGREFYDGTVWYRRTFDLPPPLSGKDLLLLLGKIDEEDITWVNGEKVGSETLLTKTRVYRIPASLLKPEGNVIAVRITDVIGSGGFSGKPGDLRLEATDTSDSISLAGTWRHLPGANLDGMPARATSSLGSKRLAGLYNGMVAPLIPYRFTGVIWYQGESNAMRADQYRTLFPAMIRDWRERWGQGDFPFLFVQIAAFRERKPDPSESESAELREAQQMALALPRTAMATAVDIGDADDIHPKNKQQVGRRLALAARALALGEKLVHSGPTYKPGSLRVDGDKARLQFDNVGGGLVAQNGRLGSFEIAGPDRKFVWADAQIDGGSVVVRSDSVSKPIAVRYAWANNPACPLFNAEGLPAPPFRTDTWPGITKGRK
jgi:sialate O-acetylesterase